MVEVLRREYLLTVTLNRRCFDRVLIDPHYQKSHPDMTDQLILDLLRLIDGQEIRIEAEDAGFAYVVYELSWLEKEYRLILTYCQESYLGIVNAFRIRGKK